MTRAGWGWKARITDSEGYARELDEGRTVNAFEAAQQKRQAGNLRVEAEMILSFLRLFRAFREMETALQREFDRRDAAETRCASLDAEVKRLNEQLVTEAHKVADVFSVHAIGRRVYTKAEAPPAAAMTMGTPTVAPRAFGRQVVQQITSDTAQKLQEIWNSIPKQN